jgi:hypothetical protein
MNEIKACQGLMDVFCKSQQSTMLAYAAKPGNVRTVTSVCRSTPLILFLHVTPSS